MADISTSYRILDRFGRPIQKEVLQTEIAGPTISGVRSPITGYPGNGLNPGRLAMIMREADQGEPMRYLELAETIEERDLHYVGVLGTRKRSVSQLEVTVEAAGDTAAYQEHAQMVRDWLARDELQSELFDIFDAIGKGVSFTEIMWDTSEGQWRPDRLEWRDPRWFRFDRLDGTTPLLRTDEEFIPLPGGKFIYATMAAKSGLPIRSGIARMASWAWMFKAFSTRDWQIFTQNYGQPIRVGKYGQAASQDDRDTLFRAVANIAGDCAAIIPDSMAIEFIESKSIGSSTDLYERRINHLDQQVSKAVLGQTATTDAIAGGHAVGRTHRVVQEDIERADARAAAALINRDLIRVWIDLEYGPQEAYPRVRIGRADVVDIQLTVESVVQLVPLGLKVGQSQMRDLIGIDKPEETDELLAPAATPVAAPSSASDLAPALPGAEKTAATETLHAQEQGLNQDAIDQAVNDMLADAGWSPVISPVVDGLGDELGGASSLDDAKAILRRRAETMGISAFTDLLAKAAFSARLAGETDESLD